MLTAHLTDKASRNDPLCICLPLRESVLNYFREGSQIQVELLESFSSTLYLVLFYLIINLFKYLRIFRDTAKSSWKNGIKNKFNLVQKQKIEILACFFRIHIFHKLFENIAYAWIAESFAPK